MKTLHVIHRLYPIGQGGTEIHVRDLIDELVDKEYDLVIFTKFYSSNGRYELKKMVRDGVTTYTLSIPKINSKLRLIKDTIYHKFFVKISFVKILIQEKPDIIHYHHLIEFEGWLPIISKLMNIKSVIDFVDYWYICPAITLPCKGNEQLCSSDCVWRYPRNIWESFFKKYSTLLNSIYGYLKVFFYKKIWRVILNATVDIFLPISEKTTNIYKEYGFDKKKMKLKPCGIPPVVLYDSKRRKNLIVGFIGAVSIDKGVRVLIKAFKKINNPKVSLDLYGKSKFEKQDLAHLIGEDSRIKLKGEFDHKDVYEVLKSIDILVVPSIWEEAYGLVIDEGLMTKKIVIASKIGGIVERIIDGKNGFLVKPGDVDDLSERIEYVTGNYDKIVGELSYKVPFTIKDEIELLKKQYANLVDQ